ncbi:MAG: shikimate dehydrogenase family protein [Huintestinicola sp.]
MKRLSASDDMTCCGGKENIMLRYGLLGFPLGHTMSPPIHDRLFKLEGVTDYEYTLKEYLAEELDSKAEELMALDGFNVTIPHKVNIIKYLDGLGESAERYNSVNCVVNKNGVHTGYNTDCDGFLRSLEAAGGSLSGKVLLCGCGGAGRMAAIEALRHGAELTLSLRKGSEQKAEPVIEYAQSLGREVKVVNPENITGSFDILVNATPVGMFPHVDGCPVSEEVIKRCGFVFDIVYNPEVTKLMAAARSHGIKAVGGMAMLVWQAAVAHELWTGARYRDEDIEEIISQMHSLMRS